MDKVNTMRCRLGAPYDDMVVRVYDGCLQLVGQARAGRRLGVLAEARALRGQVSALADLQGLAAEEEARGRGVAPVPFAPPVPVQDLTERRGD